MAACKHGETPCGETCECCCDTCQEAYEVAWSARTEKEGLCDACGIPKEPYSLDRLAHFQYVHFYCPCRDCEPGYRARMAAAGLCAICRCAVNEKGDCVRCQMALKEMERESTKTVKITPSSGDRPAGGGDVR